MCKLFIATGRFSRKQVLALLNATNNAFASSQRDGFGFAAYGGGSVAFGRYLNPRVYPGFGSDLPPFVTCPRSESGSLPEVTKALVIHGRTSTNRVTVENVHPFKKGSLYLAHNGVLRWTGGGHAPKAAHDCDTEQFLNWFDDSNQRKWVGTASTWSGYGVFGVIDSASKTLTVAKCGSGNLHWAGADGVNLFSTSPADLAVIARRSKIRVGQPIDVNRNTVTRFNLAAKNPAPLDCETWEGFGETVRDVSWHRSMGLSQMADDDKRPVASKIDPVVEFKPSNKFRGVTVPRSITKRGELFPDWEPEHGMDRHL